MAFDPEQRRRALRSFMRRHGLQPTKWEELAELGEGTLSKFLAGKTDTMQDRTYSKLADAAAKRLGARVEVSELQETDHKFVSETLSTIEHAMVADRQQILPASPLELPDRSLPGIPVMGTSLAGSEGDFQMNSGEPIDRVPRPRHLKDRVGLFCLIVSGESMWPWKRPGQIIYVDPTRPPQIGDHVVIELHPTPPDDDRPAFLKMLAGRSSTKIKLRQYNPDNVFEVEMKRVNRVLRVMTEEEILGV